MEEKKEEAAVEDESVLDKELNETIEAVKKAGDVPEPTAPAKPKEETPKVEDTSTPPASEEKKEPEYEFRVPNKGKFESDESYEKRIELMDLVKRRKLAKTDSQREQISEQIKTTKNQIRSLSGSDKISNPLNQAVVDSENTPEDEALKADKERLKQLGGATKEDIEEMLQRTQLATEVKSTLEKFIDRHTELKDEDTREVFFDFVDSNYNWQNKSGKELMTVLELARENMFKPSESIQDRVLKGANVQEKVNAMQFPGGTVAKNDFSPEKRKEIDELKATGLSEEKAIELLED